MCAVIGPTRLRRTFAAVAAGALCVMLAAGSAGASSKTAPAGTRSTAPRAASYAPIHVPGWGTEQVWNRTRDDWEPTIVSSTTDGWVYQATTRINGALACKTCPKAKIVIRKSSDGGRHWTKAQYVCACPGIKWQYDPQLAMSDDGSVYAAWLNGFRPGVVVSVSHDHAKTWSAPVAVGAPAKWSDKPALVVSHNGQDVYVSFNGPTNGDPYVAQSHDGGATWTATKVVNSQRYYFAGDAWISPNGSQIVFAEVDDNQHYTSVIHVDAIVSHNSGATWKRVKIDTVARQPDCTSAGCYDGFYGSVPWVAGDSTGHLAMFYVGASVPRRPQRVYVRRSGDGGLTWTKTRLGLSKLGANAVSPCAVGDPNGRLRLWFMDDRTGRFNVWYRQWSPKTKKWSATVRISNRRGGAPYKNSQGFGEDYGDYGGIAVTYRGDTIATWAEGPSYNGPGGTWVNLQT
jgi:hypothetical protein